MKLYLLIGFSLIVAIGTAQTKFEKEVRIKPSEVPETALSFINSFEFDKKVRWYKEYGFDNTSIEAKTKFNRKRYSIEFSKKGVFEDLEIQIDWKKIPTELKQKIDAYLNSKFELYAVEKIQSQYLGEPEQVRQYVINDSSLNDITINYEIVLNTKVDGTFKKFEFLFSSDGHYIKSIEIALKNRDNTEY